MLIDGFSPEVIAELNRNGVVEAWDQHTPSKNGYLTFSHDRYIDIDGQVALEAISAGVVIKYTTTPAFCFRGLWIRYDERPVTTNPFNQFVFRDDHPGEMLLYGPDGERVTNRASKDEIEVVLIAIDYITSKARKVVTARNARKT